MLKQLVVRLIGFCLTFIPILSLIGPIFKRGLSNLFYVKDRKVAPACLTGKLFFLEWQSFLSLVMVSCSSRGFNHGFSLCSTLRQASFSIPLLYSSILLFRSPLYLLQHYDASEEKKKKIINIIYIFFKQI